MIRTGEFADVGRGVRLHYASTGANGARPILFLHGFPEYWGAWEDLMPHFASDWHAVAPDLRGFNLSSAPTEVSAYRTREIVRDLEGLADALKWERLTLVVHDWGGAAGWYWAITNPQRIERLVVLNSPHPVPFARAMVSNPEQQAASAYMNWLRGPGAEQALAQDDYRRLDGFFYSMQRAGLEWYTPERAARYHAVWSRGLTGGLNYYRASPLYPPTKEDSAPAALRLDPAQFRVKVPTLVIWGDADRALGTCLLDGLDELVGNLVIERLPGATHWLAHEEPRRIAGLIQTWCGAA
jgi:pimeloyl-ACP methyl ester carboxylesterase